ncbi:hypothetical protein CKAN_01366900 [Cinnamomum micranthum f. kanehirae]|uniref:Uncharacterized protein n=1 Tax=Cinnamomum micranthum f. kanehirae TaxID=337451 RepID=A0A3S3MJF9_9MAGN|nr:hypothetical protein CKAN_01366900 [Cinnamomum micranthum f. kanehirae]
MMTVLASASTIAAGYCFLMDRGRWMLACKKILVAGYWTVPV